MDKAKIIGELITVSNEMGASDKIPRLLEELAKVDKEDSLGFQYKYSVPEKIQAIQNDLRAIFMRIQELNKTLAGLTDKEQQKTIMAELNANAKALAEIKQKWEDHHNKLHDH